MSLEKEVRELRTEVAELRKKLDYFIEHGNDRVRIKSAKKCDNDKLLEYLSGKEIAFTIETLFDSSYTPRIPLEQGFDASFEHHKKHTIMLYNVPRYVADNMASTNIDIEIIDDPEGYRKDNNLRTEKETLKAEKLERR